MSGDLKWTHLIHTEDEKSNHSCLLLSIYQEFATYKAPCRAPCGLLCELVVAKENQDGFLTLLTYCLRLCYSQPPLLHLASLEDWLSDIKSSVVICKHFSFSWLQAFWTGLTTAFLVIVTCLANGNRGEEENWFQVTVSWLRKHGGYSSGLGMGSVTSHIDGDTATAAKSQGDRQTRAKGRARCDWCLMSTSSLT